MSIWKWSKGLGVRNNETKKTKKTETIITETNIDIHSVLLVEIEGKQYLLTEEIVTNAKNSDIDKNSLIQFFEKNNLFGKYGSY